MELLKKPSRLTRFLAGLVLGAIFYAGFITCLAPPAIRYVSSHGVAVVGDDAPDAKTLEAWTVEIAETWKASPCPEVARADVLEVLRYSRQEGVGVRYTYADPPTASGGLIQATTKGAYQHELSHVVIAAYGLVPWAEPAHHALMCRCGLPIADAICNSPVRATIGSWQPQKRSYSHP